MITKPSVRVLKIILKRFDKEPTLLCRATYDAYAAGLLTSRESIESQQYFRHLLNGSISLEHWLVSKGLISQRPWWQTSKETMAHRRAWLVKMIEGEI